MTVRTTQAIGVRRSFVKMDDMVTMDFTVPDKFS
jgi:hypothetical protein